MATTQNVNIRFSLFVIILLLVVTLSGVFFGLAMRTRTLLHESILSQARNHFQSIVLTRTWISKHGAVYVLKTAGLESNPYLKNPDIIATDGKVYTMKNPAVVTREISQLAATEAGLQFSITSLNPLNPNNQPDPFEAKALRAFETGTLENYLFTERDEKPVFRYMAPLQVTQDCLPCHSEQGYQVGDIRGGISVTIPVQQLQEQLNRNMVAIGLAGIAVALVLVIAICALIIRLVRLLNQARASVEKLAISDGLTGIYNRRHGMERLAIEVGKAQRVNQPLCCLMIDIDHFKQINDTYGHDAGDQVLIRVAAEMRKALRRYDLLFRYGGEEFVVIFPALDLDDARLGAERLRQLCADLQVLTNGGDQQIQVLLSGGLTALNGAEDNCEALLKRADEALYRAKNAGRNRIEVVLASAAP